MKIAREPEEISKCYELMKQLRPHLSIAQFRESVSRMAQNQGYLLVYLEQGEDIVSVAGLRLAEWLHTGKYLEIEDLITTEGYRSKGFGRKLFNEILQYAKQHQCKQVRLVSGVKREDAHRFYLANGMVYEAKYFSINT